MKAVITLTVVFFFSVAAIAQNVEEKKVSTTKATVVLNSTANKISKTEKEVARLYLFKNSRIKKELAFKTKRNRSKLA